MDLRIAQQPRGAGQPPFGGPPPPAWGPPPPGYPGGGAPPPGYPGGGPPPPGFPGGPPGFGGGPPPNKPPNSGIPIPVFLGIGCVGLIFLFGLGIGVLAFMKRSGTESASSQNSPSTGDKPTLGSSGDLRAEVRDLRQTRGEFGTGTHFVGEIENKGSAPIGFPSARVTLFDSANTALESSFCVTPIRALGPGETVPCTMFAKAEKFDHFKADITPNKSFFKGKAARLNVTDVKFVRKRSTTFEVTGKVTNLGNTTAKDVNVVAGLYGGGAKIAAAASGRVAGNDIAAGASALFQISVFQTAEEPRTAKALAFSFVE